MNIGLSIRKTNNFSNNWKYLPMKETTCYKVSLEQRYFKNRILLMSHYSKRRTSMNMKVKCKVKMRVSWTKDRAFKLLQALITDREKSRCNRVRTSRDT